MVIYVAPSNDDICIAQKRSLMAINREYKKRKKRI